MSLAVLLIHRSADRLHHAIPDMERDKRVIAWGLTPMICARLGDFELGQSERQPKTCRKKECDREHRSDGSEGSCDE